MSNTSISTTDDQGVLPPLFGAGTPTPWSWSPKAKPLPGLLRWVRLLLVGFCIAEALMFVHGALLLWLLNAAANGGSPELAAIGHGIDLLGMFAGLGHTVIYVFSVIVVGRFIYRAMNNLVLSKSNAVSMSPAWAVGWYFVPIALWFKPLQGMREIWRGSQEPRQGAADVPAKMGFWWACWVISNILGNIDFRLSINAGAFSEQGITDYGLLATSTWIGLATAPFSIGAAVLLMSITSGIAQAQERQRTTSVF